MNLIEIVVRAGAGVGVEIKGFVRVDTVYVAELVFVAEYLYFILS